MTRNDIIISEDILQTSQMIQPPGGHLQLIFIVSHNSTLWIIVCHQTPTTFICLSRYTLIIFMHKNHVLLENNEDMKMMAVNRSNKFLYDLSVKSAKLVWMNEV